MDLQQPNVYIGCFPGNNFVKMGTISPNLVLNYSCAITGQHQLTSRFMSSVTAIDQYRGFFYFIAIKWDAYLELDQGVFYFTSTAQKWRASLPT